MAVSLSWTGALLALAAGVGLGAVYLLGLWATVRRLPTARWPGLLTLGSLLARLAVLMGGIYLVADQRWERVAVALAGFLLARAVLTRRLGPPVPGGRVP